MRSMMLLVVEVPTLDHVSYVQSEAERLVGLAIHKSLDESYWTRSQIWPDEGTSFLASAWRSSTGVAWTAVGLDGKSFRGETATFEDTKIAADTVLVAAGWILDDGETT